MKCKSCKLLIEKNLNELDWVTSAQVDLKNELLKVDYESNSLETKIISTIRESWYDVIYDTPIVKSVSKFHYVQIIMLFISAFILIWLFWKIEIFRFVPDGNVTISMAFLIWIVASLSSCFAIVWWIIIWFSNLYFRWNDAVCEKWSICDIVRPNMLFHIWRFISFFLLWGVLWYLWGMIQISLWFTWFLTIIIWIVMLYIWLNILNLLPSIFQSFSIIPDSLSKKILNYSRNKKMLAPFIVWVLSFFIPCGFTQSMQLAALSSWWFISWGLIMLLFALGTFPVLFLAWIWAAKSKSIPILNKLIWVLVVIFWLYSLNSWLLVTGSKFWVYFSKWNSPIESDVKKEFKQWPLFQTVKMDINFIFEPSEFKIKKGVPVRWEINWIRVSSCSNEIVIPKLWIRKHMERWLNVIEFTPTESWNLIFTCGMWMLSGKFIVE